jgi:hypothetical protein
MSTTTQKRIDILKNHLNCENVLKQENCFLFETVEQKNKKINKTELLKMFENDHPELRKKVKSFLSQDEFQEKEEQTQMTSDELQHWVYDKLVKLLDQKFLSSQDIQDDATKYFAIFESFSSNSSSLGMKFSINYSFFVRYNILIFTKKLYLQSWK